MKSISKSKSVRAPAKSVTAKSGAGTKTCVCKKKLQFLSPGYTQDGKPCNYCAACIPF